MLLILGGIYPSRMHSIAVRRMQASLISRPSLHVDLLLNCFVVGKDSGTPRESWLPLSSATISKGHRVKLSGVYGVATLSQQRGLKLIQVDTTSYSTRTVDTNRFSGFGCGASNSLAVWEVRCQEVKATESSKPIK